MSNHNKQLIINNIDNNIYYQNNSLYFLELQSLIEQHSDSYPILLKTKYKHLNNWINALLPQLKQHSYSTKCYWIIHNLYDFPICATCQAKIIKNVTSIWIGYKSTRKHQNEQIYCSIKCSNKNNVTIQQRKNTTLQHYGVDVPIKSQVVKNKIIDTIHKNYGEEYDNVLQVPSIIEKSVQTKFQKNNGQYMSDNSLNLRKQTMIQLYGGELYDSPIIREKIFSTIFTNYGVLFPFQSPVIQNKIVQSNNALHGYNRPLDKIENRNSNKNKYHYNNIVFDSSWELAFYIWLKDHNYKFEYQYKALHLMYIKDNKMHEYIPDFYLYDFDILIEIKGNQFFKNGEPIFHNKSWLEKYKCMLNNNVVIFTSIEIKDFLIYVKNKYGSNYLKSFKYKNM